MIRVDCDSCEGKPCCKYHGWKVFFLEEERNRVLQVYGQQYANRIAEFHKRTQGPVYAVDLPCPFFDESAGGLCQIYEARPFICSLFPVEIEPITETTYVDRGVCPKASDASFSPVLVQIAVDQWCEQFWGLHSSPEERADQSPIGNDCPNRAK